MQLFTNIIFAILFITIPLYYIMSFSNTYYKKVSNNKSNIKFTGKIKSIGIYTPAILLAISTILFVLSSYSKAINLVYAAIMIILTVLVFGIINITSSKFYVFDKYIVIQNDAIEFKEIRNITVKNMKKENKVEIKILSKTDINTCFLATNDSKALVKELKSLLPKNIKISDI